MKVVWKPIFPSASSWCLAWPSPQVKFSFKLLGYFFLFFMAVGHYLPKKLFGEWPFIYQLFWCELQGYRGFWHGPVPKYSI
jgi:hypothetical protein